MQLRILTLAIASSQRIFAQGEAGNGWALTNGDNSNWPYQTFITEPALQPPVLKINQTGPTGDDAIFLTEQGGHQPAATIFEPNGMLIWSSSHLTNLSLVNLTPATLKGRNVLVGWNGTTLGNLEAYGSFLIFDDSYQIIHDVQVNHPIFGTSRLSWADSHEASLTDQGTIVGVAIVPAKHNLSLYGGPEDGWIWDCVVFEVDVYTNDILFIWRVSDHLDQIPLSDSQAVPIAGQFGSGNKTSPWDAYHMNSAEPYGNGFVFSLRHTSTLYHIHKNGTVLWQIHGNDYSPFRINQFAMGPKTTFAWQHDAHVTATGPNGLVLSLLDNNNFGLGQYNTSYGVVLNVNLKNWTVTAALRLSDATNPQSAFAGGSLRSLGPMTGGHWLMNYGWEPIVKEFDSDGRCLYTLQFSPGGPASSYRAYRYDWRGFPQTKPNISACSYTDPILEPMTRVFASWNGATGVEGWKIFLGHDNATQPVAFARKTDFETQVDLRGQYEFAQVQAKGGERAPGHDGRSQVVAVNRKCGT